MKKPLILVTGATGFVGREAVAQLVDAHHPVRALVAIPRRALTTTCAPTRRRSTLKGHVCE
jgi:nucleoside-diphosphate-sugar epimerase